jgi:medium-chain acyl-[acyl-carrier-protein] hydrolase
LINIVIYPEHSSENRCIMIMTKTSSAWFQSDQGGKHVDLRMFCFPYAGGAAVVYRNWRKSLPSNVQVIPVELPGRGARLKEIPFISLPELIDDLSEVILTLLDTPFVFFGHSMGAVIAFELAQCLRRKYDREPQAVFVSGRRAPQVPDSDPISYNLPKEEFIEELCRLEGTPKEVLEHVELMEMMIPLLRADFQLIQTYNYVADLPLRCPIIVYGGLQDHDVRRETLLPWKDLTSSRFALHMLPGDHFFIRSSQALLLEMLTRELYKVIESFRINNQRR